MERILFIILISLGCISANTSIETSTLKNHIEYLEKKVDDQKNSYENLLKNQAIMFEGQKDLTEKMINSSESKITFLTWLVGIFGSLILVIGAVFGWYVSSGLYRQVDRKLRDEIKNGQNQAFNDMTLLINTMKEETQSIKKDVDATNNEILATKNALENAKTELKDYANQTSITNALLYG